MDTTSSPEIRAIEIENNHRAIVMISAGKSVATEGIHFRQEEHGIRQRLGNSPASLFYPWNVVKAVWCMDESPEDEAGRDGSGDRVGRDLPSTGGTGE